MTRRIRARHDRVSWGALLVIALLVIALVPLGQATPPRSASALATTAPRSTVPAADPTYNPIVIGPGNTTEWNGSGTRYQQGSVTVEPGGTLIVENITLSMVQFVTAYGTLAQRLSNVSRFLDEGTVIFLNANLTTDAGGMNLPSQGVYLKLNFTVTGNLTVTNSSFEFPGWLNIEDGGTATLNDSVVTSNPAVNDTSALGSTIVNDTSYAPSISVTNGAHLVLLNSKLEHTYSDNTTLTPTGFPGLLPLYANETLPVTSTSGANFTLFETAFSTQSLIQDWLYPNGVYSGSLVIRYNSSNGLALTPTVDLNGSLFPLSLAVAGPTTTWASAYVPLSSAMLTELNRLGVFQYLLDTGSFSLPPSTISVNLSANSVGSAQVMQLALLIYPPLDYNIVATGDATTVQSLDTSFDVNWNATPSSPVAHFPPYPWNSNKLLLTDGASGLLANVEIPTSPPASLTSAILVDSLSSVYSYRWAEFQVAGPGGPVPDSRVTAFSAATGRANLTATRLNALSQSAPALWTYIQWWDDENGLPGYGITGSSGATAGRAFLLLVASNLTDTEGTNATFLGQYHVGITAPLANVSTQWLNFDVTPYPQGLENGSADEAPTVNFPEYAAFLDVEGISMTADGIASSGEVRIGQTLGVNVLVKNVGATAVFNVSGVLQYVAPGSLAGVNVTTFPLTNRSVPAGSSTLIDFTWRVNESTVGVHGTIDAAVNVTIQWNGGPTSPNGSAVSSSAKLEVLPSTVAILDLAPPPHMLSPTATYVSVGLLLFNGSELATINLTATPLGGGATILVVTNESLNGTFSLTYGMLGDILRVGIPYLLSAVASYNSVSSSPYILSGNFTLPAPAPPPPGISVPWWVWAIVGAGAIGLLGFVVVRRRRTQARVECGECASLIAPGSTTCPICGSYFETGEESCARCGGRIPAGHATCPECGFIPTDRPGPPGPEDDRVAYARHVEEFRAAAHGELGDDYAEVEFWKWWRRQPSFQSFRDWKAGRSSVPSGPIGEDTGLEGIGGGR